MIIVWLCGSSLVDFYKSSFIYKGFVLLNCIVVVMVLLRWLNLFIVLLVLDLLYLIVKYFCLIDY